MRTFAEGPRADAIGAAIAEARASGTGLFGDISNTVASVEPLVAAEADAVVFSELLGFDDHEGRSTVSEALGQARGRLAGDRRSDIRLGLAAHAPYSVSPVLFRAIRDAAHRLSCPMSVHLAESAEEIEFLATGKGSWRSVLDERGRWDPEWTPPGTGPVAYLDELDWWTDRTVAVHGVQLTDRELDRLAEAGTTLVTCPRSNRWTGAGDPPIERFFASGVRVAVGTDSLASVPDLNLFREAAEMRRLAPGVPAARLLESLTRSGAEALGFSDRGAIEVGMKASLIAVAGGRSLDEADVEEYLLTGIEPGLVTWLDS